MSNDDPRNWMWSEALQMLARAERLHREAFSPPQAGRRGVNWEPPTDVLETQDAVLVLVALPGVDPINSMMDLISISRGYEANLRAFDITRSLLQRTLDLGRNR